MIETKYLLKQLVEFTRLALARKEGEPMSDEFHAQDARTCDALDAWRSQCPWPPHRESAFDRARRDPTFNTLVQLLYGLMRQGEGQYTPTEVREAAMVAMTMIERMRVEPIRFDPTPAPFDRLPPEDSP